MTVETRTDEARADSFGSEVLRGTAVSSGIGRGAAYVLACAERSAAPRREIAAAEVATELARFHLALERADAELVALSREVGEKLGASEAGIFSAQRLMLGDAAFKNQISASIQERRINVEAALSEVIDKFTSAFDEIPDAYLRERAADVRDIGRRVLSALIEARGSDVLEIPEGAVVVAEDLPPSVTARLELGRVQAFVTGRGSRFSHTSILARSQGMPAVSGVSRASLGIKTGDHLVVDAFAGVVFINPPASIEREYARLEAVIRADKQKLQELVPLPAVTLDGASVGLSANVSKLADTEAALLHNADGIGLYRTEFSFAIRKRFPTEDEQYEFLKRAAERFHPRKVVFRLLDLGGDKDLPYLALPAARNPSLAQRGIRLLFKYPEVLKSQLRAFLRVAADHPISILLPMVGGVEDVRSARAVLAEVEAELACEGKRFGANVPLGAMIEVPAAALLARSLAREVEFFSLGTNDLVQYVLAADREDENVAPYYQPAHPAVLQLIASLTEAAAETGRPLTICGDMAGDPFYTELLLGLGLCEFSVAPGEILDVKKRIRETHLDSARDLARRCLELGSTLEIKQLLDERRS